jgi:alpha-tubulin suppressor-like RCC1 family protein
MMAGMVRTMVCAFAASALAFLATAHADGLVANNIATGESHACAVAPSGEVVCWGSDASGQVSGTAAGTRVQRPMIVPGLTGVKVVEVSAGTDGTCALETTGAVWCWGNNSLAGRGLSSFGARFAAPAPVRGISDAVHIVLGGDRACAVRKTGAIACWGSIRDDDGRLPVQVAGITNAVQVAIGYSTCARLGDGGVTCWGNELGATPPRYHAKPEPVAITDAIDIAGGDFHLCAVHKSGQVSCWGTNGTLGGQIEVSSKPIDVSVTDAVAVAAGGDQTCALRKNGEVACWGTGMLGDGSDVKRAPPAAVRGIADATQLAVGRGFACARRAMDAVTCWGHNEAGQLGIDTGARPQPTASKVARPSVIALSSRRACAVVHGRNVQCWGEGGPSELRDSSDVVELAGGSNRWCGRRASGEVSCWGAKLAKLPKAAALAMTNRYECIVRADHTVYCSWDAPKGWSPSADIVELAAGADFACARDRANHATCWGRHYELPAPPPVVMGDVVEQEPPPVPHAQVERKLATASHIAARGDHLCGLVDSSVVCTGRLRYENLPPVPEPASTTLWRTIGGGPDIEQIVVGTTFGCLRRRSGTVECWGNNVLGELGIGTVDDQEHGLEVVKGIEHAVGLAAGDHTACAWLKSGIVKCWGDNAYGQVGDGTSGNQLVPGPPVNRP